MDQPHTNSESTGVFHQEADAIRTLLIVLLASLRRNNRISANELDDIFWAASHLVGERWGPHSVASIVLNGCWEEVVEAKAELVEHPAA